MPDWFLNVAVALVVEVLKPLVGRRTRVPGRYLRLCDRKRDTAEKFVGMRLLLPSQDPVVVSLVEAAGTLGGQWTLGRFRSQPLLPLLVDALLVEVRARMVEDFRTAHESNTHVTTMPAVDPWLTPAQAHDVACLLPPDLRRAYTALYWRRRAEVVVGVPRLPRGL